MRLDQFTSPKSTSASRPGSCACGTNPSITPARSVERLGEPIRELVLDDQRWRNDICCGVSRGSAGGHAEKGLQRRHLATWPTRLVNVSRECQQ
jgi:hypothetical protein